MAVGATVMVEVVVSVGMDIGGDPLHVDSDVRVSVWHNLLQILCQCKALLHTSKSDSSASMDFT